MNLLKYFQILISFLYLLEFPYLQAQSFQKSFDGGNGEICTYINYCTNGKFIGTGDIAPPTLDTSHICLFQTDEWGNLYWFKYFSGNSLYGDSFNYGAKVLQTIDGGFILTGGAMSHSAGDYDAFLLKTDSLGNISWMKNYGGTNKDWGTNVIETSDTGFLLIGNTISFSTDTIPPLAFRRDIYLVKTNDKGDTAWTRTFSGGYTDFGTTLLETMDGYIIAGSFSGVTAFVAKINFGGDTVWTKHFRFDYKEQSFPNDTARNDLNQLYSIKQDVDGDYIITGILDQDINEIHDFFLMKTDAEFNPLWAKSYSPSTISTQLAYTRALFADYTTDGGHIIAGKIYNNDAFLMKTDNSGQILWTKKFNYSDDSWWYSLVKTPDNGFLIGCWSDSISGNSPDIYLIKTDSLGNGGGCNEYSIDFLQKELTIDIIQGGTVGNTETIVTDVTNFLTVNDYDINDSLLCSEVEVEENFISKNRFLIYPNPAINQINISANLTLPYQIEIYDITGRKVFTKLLTDYGIPINISTLHRGLYLYQLKTKECTLHNGKLIIL